MTIIYRVTNNRTEVGGYPDPWFLARLDDELRYPTALAQAKEAGFTLPDDDPNPQSKWDGWVRLFHQPKTIAPWFPTGLLSRAIRLSEKFSQAYRVEDLRERPVEGIPDRYEPIPLRDYQANAARAAVAAGQGVLDIPPRGGKTRIMCEVHRQVSLPTVWIAPTDRIVQQTRDVVAGFFGQHYVEHVTGSQDPNRSYPPVVVCTAATAMRLSPEFYLTREMLVVDEFHHSAARSYREIIDRCEHIHFRYGMTGTFFRSGADALAMHSLLADTVYKITSRELLARGHLVPAEVVFLPVAAPKLRGVGSGFQTGHGKHGVQEHVWRNQMVTWASVLLAQTGRRVLVLVGTKAQGRELQSMMRHLLAPAPKGAEFQPVEFLSTSTPRSVQTRAIRSFLESEEIRILIGTSLLGEGVDLPTADALVYARGEKAEVSLVQNAYRTSTAVPGKRYAIIVDFADRHHKKLMNHSLERLAVYHREPTFRVKILDDAVSFPEWLRGLG